MTETLQPANPSEVPATILVVDDNPNNLAVISDHLKQQHYRVIVARDGASGIERAEYAIPDLILLDVLMPGMDGYETCRQLKAHEKIKDIPVIFMTALSEASDKVKAFQCGGVDYITKPFHQEEVLARVHTHLQLRKRTLELEKTNEDLRSVQEFRDDLVHMVVHDLRSPLWGINANLQMLVANEPDITEDGRYAMQDMCDSSSLLLEMVGSILDVNKMETHAMHLHLAEMDLADTARAVMRRLASLLRSREGIVSEPSDGASCKFVADEGLISRVIENLVSNAIKFTPDTGGRIEVRIEPLEHCMRVCVIDNGYGVPEEHRDMVFDKYGQVETRRSYKKYSTGLGLPFCKMAVEAHGGRIWLAEPEGQGTFVQFEIPRSGAGQPTQ